MKEYSNIKSKIHRVMGDYNQRERHVGREDMVEASVLMALMEMAPARRPTWWLPPDLVSSSLSMDWILSCSWWLLWRCVGVDES